MIELAAATHDAFDGPEIATVVSQVLVFAGVLVSVIYGRNANQNAKAARAQVENDHKTNFREDADEKHEEQQRQLKDLKKGQDRLASEFHGFKGALTDVGEDIGLLKEGWRSNRARIIDLEQTDPHLRRTPQESAWGPPRTRAERRRRYEDG